MVPIDLHNIFICFIESQTIFKKLACEGSQLELQCDRGEEIRVVSANYGRSSTKICGSEDRSKVRNVECESRHKSNMIVSRACNDRRECRILATNAVFGDPCFNTLKYLQVEFICERNRRDRHGNH